MQQSIWPASTGTKHDLLTEEIISITAAGRTELRSLPHLYADLATDRVDGFPKLRPHQRHHWHTTLCQMGAIAMIQAGMEELPETPGEWLTILRELTEQFPDDEPWCLINSDITIPAFLQPPASSPEKHSEYKDTDLHPDEMDLTVGSKRHDVKDGVIGNNDPETWLYALVSRQTGGGFDGNRLYGISRMNSGMGSRHTFSISPSIRWGKMIARDVKVLAREYQGKDVKHLLLWLRPWDGLAQESISIDRLEPQALYMETCRRIRLEEARDGSITARRATSHTARIAGREAKGLTDDPWTITKPDSAVTIAAEGFSYKQIAKYLDPQQFSLPLLAKRHEKIDGSQEMHLIARAMVRGQGKTEGYHERMIPLGSVTAGMLGSKTQQVKLAAVIKARLETIAAVQRSLASAVKAYLQNGESAGIPSKEHKKVMDQHRAQMDSVIDRTFWNQLRAEIEGDNPESARSWWTWEEIIPLAESILKQTTNSGMCRHQDRFKAATAAQAIFHGMIRKSDKLSEQEKPQDE